MPKNRLLSLQCGVGFGMHHEIGPRKDPGVAAGVSTSRRLVSEGHVNDFGLELYLFSLHF